MSGLDNLLACEGNWHGTNRLQDPNTNAPDESPSTATVVLMLGGKFVRIDYTWVYQGTPQAGSLLIGYESQANLATAVWIDTWHVGDTIMVCKGNADADGAISVRGAYAAPGGPDWGWRTVIRPSAGRSLHVVMHNISPDGQEYLAVEADYKPA
jgi:hypothetical protein